VTPRLLRDERPWRIGHRGAASLAPENTIAAFEAAVALGVDAVEFDVVSPDGRSLAVAHDVGGAAAPLDETLAFFAQQDVTIQVDLKAFGHERSLVDALRRHDLVERAVVSSFRADTLRALAGVEPRVARALTYPEDRLGISRRRPFSLAVRGGLVAARRLLPRRIGTMVERAAAAVATLHYAVVTPAAIGACHDRDVAVWAWTVNDAAVAATLESWGVDGIITDDPRIFGGPSSA
jgi:glycerophosphoryl diester phosphodiesterase